MSCGTTHRQEQGPGVRLHRFTNHNTSQSVLIVKVERLHLHGYLKVRVGNSLVDELERVAASLHTVSSRCQVDITLGVGEGHSGSSTTVPTDVHTRRDGRHGTRTRHKLSTRQRRVLPVLEDGGGSHTVGTRRDCHSDLDTVVQQRTKVVHVVHGPAGTIHGTLPVHHRTNTGQTEEHRVDGFTGAGLAHGVLTSRFTVLGKDTFPSSQTDEGVSRPTREVVADHDTSECPVARTRVDLSHLCFNHKVTRSRKVSETEVVCIAMDSATTATDAVQSRARYRRVVGFGQTHSIHSVTNIDRVRSGLVVAGHLDTRCDKAGKDGFGNPAVRLVGRHGHTSNHGGRIHVDVVWDVELCPGGTIGRCVPNELVACLGDLQPDGCCQPRTRIATVTGRATSRGLAGLQTHTVREGNMQEEVLGVWCIRFANHQTSLGP